jgi:hypothetical protein
MEGGGIALRGTGPGVDVDVDGPDGDDKAFMKVERQRGSRTATACPRPQHNMSKPRPLSASVPAEIWDVIIDFLHDDQAALASCSLVRRDWTPASRYHHFVALNLNHPRKISRLLKLLMSSYCTIIPHVREIFLGARSSENELQLQDKLGPLVTLTKLESLVLCYVDWHDLLDPLPAAAFWRFTSLSSLELRHVQFDSFHHFVEALSGLTKLHRLSLINLKFPDRTTSSTLVCSSLSRRVAQQLRTLEMVGGDPTRVIHWLLLQQTTLAIRVLQLNYLRHRDVASVGNLLREIGPSLEHLVLSVKLDNGWRGSDACAPPLHVPCAELSLAGTPNDLRQDLDLRCNYNLRSVRLSLNPLQPNFSQALVSTAEILATLASSKVEKLTCEFLVFDTTNFRSPSWSKIDGTLRPPTFMHLQKMELALRVAGGHNAVDAFVECERRSSIIRSTLPILSQRGVLDICVSF